MNLQLKDHTFRVWYATPSLNRILLRSPKNELEGRFNNIDIIFWGVYYLNIPFTIRGFYIDRATELESDQISKLLGRDFINESVFVIVSEEKRYYIVAVNYTVQENTLDIFDISIQESNT